VSRRSGESRNLGASGARERLKHAAVTPQALGAIHRVRFSQIHVIATARFTTRD